MMLSTDSIMPSHYTALRRLARARMRGESPGHTLQATALVHEAYLRLLKMGEGAWQNDAHFFASFAEAMRRILIERARRYSRVRHGHGLCRVSLEEAERFAMDNAPEIIALDEALEMLEQLDRRKATVVKLRYYLGLTIEETAKTLEVSVGTVTLDWSFARAWLRQRIAEAGV